ncbi:unnamed protein product, partial [marine sediment metagenome]
MIKNKTNNKILAKNTVIAISALKKATGLMFSNQKKDFALVFEFGKEKIVS